MVHIPFAMGAIGIFHHVPLKYNGGNDLKITGCVLAKIFATTIDSWDDDDIKALNPDLSFPDGYDASIKVVHRVGGSSSTAGTTEYLFKTCPAQWAPLAT